MFFTHLATFVSFRPLQQQQQQQQPFYGLLSGTTGCLAIFLHNFSPCPVWSTSWSGALHLIFHTFLHPISVVFSQHMPIPLQSVLLSQLLTWNSVFYLNITHPSDHSHLCSLKCHLIFFPDMPGITSM